MRFAAVHERVNSRQRSTSVVFGAKRILIKLRGPDGASGKPAAAFDLSRSGCQTYHRSAAAR